MLVSGLASRFRAMGGAVVGAVALAAVISGCSAAGTGGTAASASGSAAATTTAATSVIATPTPGGAISGATVAASTVTTSVSAPPAVAPTSSASATSTTASSLAILSSTAASSTSAGLATTAPTVASESSGASATTTTAAVSGPAGTPTPLAGCATPPVRGFGLVWQGQAAARTLVGCPTGGELAVGVTTEAFQQGWMVELSADTPGQGAKRTVYVLFKDNGTVAQAPDPGAAGSATAPAGATPPAGTVAPAGSFGAVWREDPSMQARLGWATGAAQAATGAWQPYQRGQMVWIPTPKQIFVIGAQGPDASAPATWQVYPDLFTG